MAATLEASHVVGTQTGSSLQEFLAAKQYTDPGITKYEIVFGEGYVSGGGHDQTQWLCSSYLDGHLKSGDSVLDVGCGLGRMTVAVADRYNAAVLGVDITDSMIQRAKQKYDGHKLVTFQYGDITKMDFPPNTFNLIYTRDTLLHIHHKQNLLKKFKEWLKPGELLLITDYGAEHPSRWTDAFKSYLNNRGYELLELDCYKKLLVDNGLDRVLAQDITPRFYDSIRREREQLVDPTNGRRKLFLQQYPMSELQHMVTSYDEKLARVESGNQKHLLLLGHKPM